MIVLSSSRGVTLAFENDKDLATVISHLQGLRRHKRGRGYPATYLTFEEKGTTEAHARAEIVRARRALGRRG